MPISFHEWNDTPVAHRLVHSLNKDDVQVWMASVPLNQDLSAWYALLSADERQRADRFRIEPPRREYTFARATLRQILGAVFDVAPNAVEFAYEAHGKPLLRHPISAPAFQFNLSHADQHVAVALSRHRRVGVDIESTQRTTDWAEVAKRIFSPGELKELYALPEAQRPAGFFKGWTCKEAYLKATGEGLIDDLPSLEVSVTLGTPPRLVSLPSGSNDLHRWEICEIPVPLGWAGALVWESESLKKSFTD